MFTSSKMSMSTASQPKFMTTTMKEKTAERNGARRIIINPKKKSPPKDELVLPGGHEFPYTAGSFYVGEWQGDKKSGFGTQTWTSGDKYEGEWSEGKQQGKGSFWKKENGRLRKRYAGDWVGGQRTGLGVLVYKNGDKYEGEWARNERHGSGNMSYADGGHYEGGWVANKRAGLGIFRLANGDRYEGHWLNDDKEGPGRYFYKSTRKVYEGEWVAGVPRCGAFRDATPAELKEPEPAPGAENAEAFKLPALSLLQPEAVLSKRVAEIRQLRASKAAETADPDQVVRSFNDDELAVLRHVFTIEDKQSSGLVPATAVGYMLERCRMPIDEVSIERLLLELEADDDTRITFAEFVDMAALLLSA
jgi:hypothetical protein